MKNENYEEFEGKSVTFVNYNGEEIEAIVALFDEDIGITIVEKENKNRYLACLIRQKSPKWRTEFNKRDNEAHFKFLVNSIKKGKIDIPNYKNLNINQAAILTQTHCAF